MPTRTARRTPDPAPLPAPTVAEPAAPLFDADGGAPPSGEPAASAPPPAQSATPAATSQPGYKGLKVWQRAMDLATGVYMLTRTLPDDEQEAIGAELRETAVRIPASIAAGNSLYQRAEYVHCLSTAHGAVARLESTLLLAERLGLARGKSHSALLSNAADVGRMLRGLIRALQPPPAEGESPAPRSVEGAATE